MLLPPQLHLIVLPGEFAVCRLPADAALPPAPSGTAFWSVTVTSDEISIVCQADNIPADAEVHRGLRAIKAEGPIEFDVVGVLGSLTAPLSQAKVSVFGVSTYDTDYILVSDHDLRQAATALKVAGHRIDQPTRE
jgi:hypothetical protein